MKVPSHDDIKYARRIGFLKLRVFSDVRPYGPVNIYRSSTETCAIADLVDRDMAVGTSNFTKSCL